MTAAAMSPEEQLIDDIASFTHDPLGYALYAFPWSEEGTELAHATGPANGKLMHSARFATTCRTRKHVISR